jgi:hypothetical protein
MAVTIKNAGFWDVTPCGSCRNDVSEKLTTFIITLMVEAVLSFATSFLQQSRGVTSEMLSFFSFYT